MRLTQIDLRSFRSYVNVQFDVDSPRILTAGLNGAGKTGLKEALRWILLGHCDGTDGRGAGAEVLTPPGEKTVEAACVIAGIGRVHRLFAVRGGGSFDVEGFTGNSQAQYDGLLSKLRTQPMFLEAVLDSERFLALDHKAGKDLLLSLLDVRVRIGDTDYTMDGLDVLYQQAFEDRKVAKKVQSAHQLPPMPEGSVPPALEAIEGQLQKLRAKHMELAGSVGETVGTRNALHADLTRLEGYIAEPVMADPTEQIAAVEAELKALDSTPAPTAPPADAGERLVFFRREAELLARHTASRGCVMGSSVPCQTPQEAFAGRVQALGAEIVALERQTAGQAGEKASGGRRTTLQAHLTALRAKQTARDASFKNVQRANAEMAGIKDRLSALPSVQAQESQMDDLKGRIQKGEDLLRQARAFWTATSVRDEAVKRNEALKLEVGRTESACELLGPKGLRVKALEDAKRRFEAAVNPFLRAFGWTIEFSIEPWQVMANGRPVDTYSRSERYRIGIALQLAIASISGLSFAVIDEIDMLDVENRKALSAMLIKAPLEQILVLGTREPSQAFVAAKGLVQFRVARDKHGLTTIAERVAVSEKAS